MGCYKYIKRTRKSYWNIKQLVDISKIYNRNDEILSQGNLPENKTKIVEKRKDY